MSRQVALPGFGHFKMSEQARSRVGWAKARCCALPKHVDDGPQRREKASLAVTRGLDPRKSDLSDLRT
jgi:hypothetical protein